MPDANGQIKGTGWSRKAEDAWDRIFGDAATPRPGDYVRIDGFRRAGLVRRCDDQFVYVTPENGLLNIPPQRWERWRIIEVVPREPADEVPDDGPRYDGLLPDVYDVED